MYNVVETHIMYIGVFYIYLQELSLFIKFHLVEIEICDLKVDVLFIHRKTKGMLVCISLIRK